MKRRRYRTLKDYLARGPETQDELAARLGISQSAVSMAARGGSCSLMMAKRISRATGVPVDSFGPPVEDKRRTA